MKNLTRLGRFHIRIQTIEEHPELVRLLMAELIIIESVIKWDTRSIHYLAESRSFYECEPHLVAPDYKFEIRMDYFLAMKQRPTTLNTASLTDSDLSFPLFIIQSDGMGPDKCGRVRIMKQDKAEEPFEVVTHGLMVDQAHGLIGQMKKESKENEI